MSTPLDDWGLPEAARARLEQEVGAALEELWSLQERFKRILVAIQPPDVRAVYERQISEAQTIADTTARAVLRQKQGAEGGDKKGSN